MFSYLPDIFMPDGDTSPEALIKSLADAGARQFVFSHAFCRKCLAGERNFAGLVKFANALGGKFTDAHAPYDATFDFNGDGSQIENHKRLIASCAEANIGTYTIHIGPAYDGQTAQQSLSQAKRSAEKLIPFAQDADIVLCVENIYYPTTAVPLLLDFLQTFDCQNFRFCYDSGHANIMTRGVRDKSHVDWVRAHWEKAKVHPVIEDFSPLHDYIATCHLHDNSGASDDHTLPMRNGGNIDWPAILKWIKSSPSLISLQTESHGAAYRKTAAETVEAFEEISETASL